MSSTMPLPLPSPLLHHLHWLKAAERTDYKLAVLVYTCLHGTAPPYLADEFYQSADYDPRRRLRSTSSSTLVVWRTQLSTIGDRGFPVASARVWNGLPRDVTSEPSLPVFCRRLKSHLFTRFPLTDRTVAVPAHYDTISLDSVVLVKFLVAN